MRRMRTNITVIQRKPAVPSSDRSEVPDPSVKSLTKKMISNPQM